MGASPYCYVTDYKDDLQKVLEDLKLRELRAGRYAPCFESKTGKYLFEYPLAPRQEFPVPGGCHQTVEAARSDADESGTNSILDMEILFTEPLKDTGEPSAQFFRFLTTAPLSDSLLTDLFGSPKPTLKQIIDVLLARGDDETFDTDLIGRRDAFWDRIGRGQSRYVIAYADGQPDKVFFGGFSID